MVDHVSLQVAGLVLIARDTSRGDAGGDRVGGLWSLAAKPRCVLANPLDDSAHGGDADPMELLQDVRRYVELAVVG
jgi:hypothetical protein